MRTFVTQSLKYLYRGCLAREVALTYIYSFFGLDYHHLPLFSWRMRKVHRLLNQLSKERVSLNRIVRFYKVDEFKDYVFVYYQTRRGNERSTVLWIN